MNEHDNHEENEECDEDCDCEEEDADTAALEEEFKAHVEKAHEEIYKHVAAAEAELDKAIELAHKHGVSFYSGISHLGQNYNVEVLEKFSDLEQDFIDEVTDTYNEYGGEGWEHSAVC